MRFAPTQDQIDFAEATRSVLTRAGGSSAVRAAWQTGTPPRSLWDPLTDLGLLTLLAGEEHGGGGTELELVAACLEVGRAAAPGPIVETAAVGVPLLSVLAPEFLDEDRVRRGITASTSPVVPYLAAGTALLLDSDRVSVVDLEGVVPVDSLDSSRWVGRLDEQRLQTANPIADGPHAAAEIARARDRASACTAGVLLGLSTRAIELTIKYTSARRQFGVPIGSFQAIKHHVANAHTAVEMARPVVEAAAWALASDDADAGHLAAMAKLTANNAARTAAKVSLQCHGAIGYTMEADLHLYLMRIWSLLNAWGSSEALIDRIAQSL